MGLSGARAYPQNYGPLLEEIGVLIPKITRLRGATWGIILGIKIKDDGPALISP
jgi:hypothetical protein